MRDFFYNKSDVFIAVLIIVVAVVVIYARVGVIMDYPGGESGGSVLPKVDELLDSAINRVTGSEARTDEDAAGVGQLAQMQPQEPSQGQGPASAPDAQPFAGEEPSASETPPDQVQEPAQAEPELPTAQGSQPSTASVQVTVSAGDAASVIADKLLAAGAITDKQAFLSEVIAQGADSKLKMGTFTIPANSSVQEIIKILVG